MTSGRFRSPPKRLAPAPSMGALLFRGLTFIMALLNIRLNYLLPHPANVRRRPWRFLDRSGQVGLGYLLAIDLGGISPAKNALAKAHHATGKIIYPDDEEGLFIYLKLAYTGDEPEYLRYYRRLSPKFPHESTGNQFFGETQFEVYRALGIHTARGVLEDLRAIATDHRDSTTGG